MLQDHRNGIYKRLVIRDNRLRGAVLYGDAQARRVVLRAHVGRTGYRRRCATGCCSVLSTCQAGSSSDMRQRSARPAPIAASAAAFSSASTGDGVEIAGDPRPSRQLRPPVLEGRGARRHRRPRGAASASAAFTARRVELGRGADQRGGMASRDVIQRHGPDAVALYVSGQLLTEDYYVANKLMKGFIGSANIDTNSRLCMASAVAGHRRAFGEDLVPGCYEDLTLADLIVLVGSNTAWCHPVLFRRIVQAKERRPDLKLVVIDPRRTATGEIADLHLPIRSGTDVWLFNGLLA